VAELRVPARFCGPPGVANGGFASGSLAVLLGGAAEVTLRRPVPLDRPLPVRDGDGALAVEDGGVLLAEARPAKPPVALPALPATVTPQAAEAAAGRSPYYDDPVFPGCFVCGPARPAGDGLRIFPGRVAGRTLWAAPWTPEETVAGTDGHIRPEVIWAALDCPSGIATADAADLPAGTRPCSAGWPPPLGGGPGPATAARWSPGRWPATAASSTPGRPCSAPTARCSPPPGPCGSPWPGAPWWPAGRVRDRQAARGGVDAHGDPP
jgi:hypothetical protein